MKASLLKENSNCEEIHIKPYFKRVFYMKNIYTLFYFKNFLLLVLEKNPMTKYSNIKGKIYSSIQVTDGRRLLVSWSVLPIKSEFSLKQMTIWSLPVFIVSI